MKEVKKELLITATKELNKLLFDPDDKDIIDVDLEPDKLCVQIKDAAKLLEPDDELTDKTVQVLKDLGVKGFGEEQTDNEPEELSLKKEIEDAPRMRDLKDIAKSNDEFKAIRGELSKFKSIKDLRKAMLKVLEEVPEETEPEKVAPKKEKEEKKAKPDAKKPEPKKAEPKSKATKLTISRGDAVAQAIRKLCKRGATMQEIMDKGDEIYVEVGGKSNPTATNVNRYALNALVTFDVLSVNDNGKYKFVNK